MTFLVKCSCGNIDERNDPNRIIACSSCGSKAALRPICAGCGKEISNQDVKECKGMLVHANRQCWDSYWNKN